MRKQGVHMPSLEVMIERLPQALIAGLEGPDVKQDLVSLQSMPALDMTTVAMLLRRKLHPMPLLEVSLERLPDSVMSNFISKKKGNAVIPLSDVTLTPSHPLLSAKISKGFTLPSLEVALERIPHATMSSLLGNRKAVLLAGKGKKKVGQLKNSRKI